MSFSKSKFNHFFLASVLSIGLTACASQAPRVTNAALGYTVADYSINNDTDEKALSTALGSALDGTRISSARPAKADVTIEFVRYNSPVIGLFYGGQHYASLTVKLSDDDGSRILAFPVYVAANGERATADQELAKAAVDIIAAQAANAFMPIKMQPKAISKQAETPVVEADEKPLVIAPEADVASQPADTDAPCVIGPDGNCIDL